MSTAKQQFKRAQRQLRVMKSEKASATSLRDQEREVGSLWMDMKLEESAKRRQTLLEK